MFPFKQVTVVGVGLLGGSFALGLRSAGFTGKIHGVGRSLENLASARRRRIVDVGFTSLREGVEGADMVCLATPVTQIVPIVEQCSPILRRGAIVMDVGSVKGDLVTEAERSLPAGVSFVGAHPIAGGEESGAASARRDLFRESLCVLTPTAGTETSALETVTALWTALGARVVRMDPHDHDRVYGAVSHLPHVVAYALVDAVLSGHTQDRAPFCGAGFRDATRIAASSPDIWGDIFRLNRENVLAALDVFEEALERYRAALQGEDWNLLRTLMEKAVTLRHSVQGAPAPEALPPRGKRR